MSTGTASGRARLRGRIDTAVQTLHPGYFAFVMATGIISTGTFLLGPSWLSQALLIAASAGLIALAAALTVRVFRFHSAVVAAATLLPIWRSQATLLATAAVSLWSVGLVLYLILVSLIMLRWLTVPMTPAALGPPYWILMGATAITVLAGGKNLGLLGTLPVVRAPAGFIEGSSFALWAFGTWWIPLLVVLGLWRHVRRHWPLSYEPTLWSIVFPLGMYSVATLTFGTASHLHFMEPLARFMLWVAVAAWALVATAFGIRLAKAWR
jgi:tellurite resistance protein TehA-like permease